MSARPLSPPAGLRAGIGPRTWRSFSVNNGFLSTLGTAGIFDLLLAEMRLAPMREKLVVVTAGGTASEVAEGGYKPVSSMTTDVTGLTETKIVALVVLTKESEPHGGVALQLLEAAMRNTVAGQTDRAFIGQLITDAGAPIASAGVTDADVLLDIRALLEALPTDALSSLHLVMSSTVAKRICTMGTTLGARAFPDMGPAGGELCKIPAHVTDVLTDKVLLVDAGAYVANGGELMVDIATQADIVMNTAPSGPAAVVSLWHRIRRRSAWSVGSHLNLCALALPCWPASTGAPALGPRGSSHAGTSRADHRSNIGRNRKSADKKSKCPRAVARVVCLAPSCRGHFRSRPGARERVENDRHAD